MQGRAARIVSLATWLAAPAVLFAEGAEKSLELVRFNALELNGCVSAQLVPGTPQQITVNGTAKQLAGLRVRQSGGTVTVGPADGWTSGIDLCRDKVEVHVTASFDKNAAVALTLRGAADLDAQVPSVARLTATVAGSGDLTLRGGAADCRIEVVGSGDATAHALSCTAKTAVGVHGSGSVTLEGRTRSCAFELRGSGDVAAREYSCDVASVEVSGTGSVELASVGDLAVQIRGRGNVSYRGQPTLRAVDIHGGGRLRRL